MSGIRISASGDQGIQLGLQVPSVRIDLGIGPARGVGNPQAPPTQPGQGVGSPPNNPPVSSGPSGPNNPNSPGGGPGGPNPGGGPPVVPGEPGNGSNVGQTGAPGGGNMPGNGNVPGNPGGPGNGNIIGQMPGQGNPYGSPQVPTMNPGQFPGGNTAVPGGIPGQPGLGPSSSFYSQPGMGQAFGMPGPALGTGNSIPQVLPPGFQSEVTGAIDYLNGRDDGSSLLPGTRQLLSQVGSSVGHSALRDFITQSGQSGTDALGRMLLQANQTDQQTGASHSQSQIRDLTNELLYTVQLTRHLSQLEQTGGPAVQRAREMSLSLPGLNNGPQALTGCLCANQVSIAELLRDVRSGAFLQACEMNSPLPLGGSVRISREMAALIRTIDAILNSIANMGPGAGAEYEGYFLGALKGWLGIDEAMARLLISWLPMLPARAGRMQIMAFLAAFGGYLTDAKGKPLMLVEGSPAKLGELLWFGPTGGLFDPTGSDRSTLRLSPMMVYGFDAIFSLVASDGRALALPIFMAIQAQVNGSRPECLFGQQPLSEGWMRALIERLKDSAQPEQNKLGERLEVALTDGRFHLGVLRGSVEDGLPIRDTFDLALGGGSLRQLSAASPAFG